MHFDQRTQAALRAFAPDTELTLGATVHDRVRFAAVPGAL